MPVDDCTRARRANTFWLRYGKEVWWLLAVAAFCLSCEKSPAPSLAYCHSVDVEGQDTEKCFSTMDECDSFLNVFNVPSSLRDCAGVASVWCFQGKGESCFATRTACVTTREAVESEDAQLSSYLSVPPHEFGPCRQRRAALEPYVPRAKRRWK